MEIGLKWVHMAQYELILKLDGALWLTIILKPLLTPKGAMESSKIRKKLKNLLELAQVSAAPKVKFVILSAPSPDPHPPRQPAFLMLKTGVQNLLHDPHCHQDG